MLRPGLTIGRLSHLDSRVGLGGFASDASNLLWATVFFAVSQAGMN